MNSCGNVCCRLVLCFLVVSTVTLSSSVFTDAVDTSSSSSSSSSSPSSSSSSSKAKTTVASWTISTASFIPPAVPAIGSSTPASAEMWIARSKALSNGYGTYEISNHNNKNSNHHDTRFGTMTTSTTRSTRSTNTQLFGKKKKGDSGGTSSSTGSSSPPSKKGKKVQVKLLKHIAGTGQAGEVVYVTQAFFQNKLRPTQSARIISDEEVQKEQSEKAALEEEIQSTATQLREQLSSDDTILIIRRKAGPNGQLFGGIGPKLIMTELREQSTSILLNEESSSSQQFLTDHHRLIKILSIKDENGKKVRGDIKHTGQYSAMIALTKDISTELSISVQAITEQN